MNEEHKKEEAYWIPNIKKHLNNYGLSYGTIESTITEMEEKLTEMKDEANEAKHE